MARDLFINGTLATNVKDKTGATMWKVVDGNDSPNRAVWFEEPHFEGMSFADNQGIIANNETVIFPPPFTAGAIPPQNGRGFSPVVIETNPAKQTGYAWYDTANARWLGWTYTAWWCRSARNYVDQVAVGNHMVCTPWTDGTKIKWNVTHTLDPIETGGVGHGMNLTVVDGASYNNSGGSKLADGVTAGSGYFAFLLNSTGTDFLGLCDPLNGHALYWNNAIYVETGTNSSYMLRFTKESGSWYLRFYYGDGGVAGSDWQYKTSVTHPPATYGTTYNDYHMSHWTTASSSTSNAIKVTIGSTVQRQHQFDGIASDGIDHSW